MSYLGQKCFTYGFKWYFLLTLSSVLCLTSSCLSDFRYIVRCFLLDCTANNPQSSLCLLLSIGTVSPLSEVIYYLMDLPLFFKVSFLSPMIYFLVLILIFYTLRLSSVNMVLLPVIYLLHIKIESIYKLPWGTTP